MANHRHQLHHHDDDHHWRHQPVLAAALPPPLVQKVHLHSRRCAGWRHSNHGLHTEFCRFRCEWDAKTISHCTFISPCRVPNGAHTFLTVVGQSEPRYSEHRLLYLYELGSGLLCTNICILVDTPCLGSLCHVIARLECTMSPSKDWP